jgi:hypothetical protein
MLATLFPITVSFALFALIPLTPVKMDEKLPTTVSSS